MKRFSDSVSSFRYAYNYDDVEFKGCIGLFQKYYVILFRIWKGGISYKFSRKMQNITRISPNFKSNSRSAFYIRGITSYALILLLGNTIGYGTEYKSQVAGKGR